MNAMQQAAMDRAGETGETTLSHPATQAGALQAVDFSSSAYDAYFGQVRKYAGSLPRYILWDSTRPDYPVEWTNPGRPSREGELGFFRHDIVHELMSEAKEEGRREAAQGGYGDALNRALTEYDARLKSAPLAATQPSAALGDEQEDRVVAVLEDWDRRAKDWGGHTEWTASDCFEYCAEQLRSALAATGTATAAREQEAPAFVLPHLRERLQDHTCERVEHVSGAPGLTLYVTKLGAHPEFQLFATEAFALWTNLGNALAPILASRNEAPAAPSAERPLPLTKLNDIASAAQIAFCLGKAPSYEIAFARGIEAAHGVASEPQPIAGDLK